MSGVTGGEYSVLVIDWKKLQRSSDGWRGSSVCGSMREAINVKGIPLVEMSVRIDKRRELRTGEIEGSC